MKRLAREPSVTEYSKLYHETLEGLEKEAKDHLLELKSELYSLYHLIPGPKSGLWRSESSAGYNQQRVILESVVNTIGNREGFLSNLSGLITPLQRIFDEIRQLDQSPQDFPVEASMTKTREALWPFSKGLPEKFEVPQRCLCDTFGLACSDGPPVKFEKTKSGEWKVNGKTSPLSDEEAKLLLKKCDVKEASMQRKALENPKAPTSLEEYKKLKKKDVKKLKAKEFNRVTNDVVAELLRLEKEVKALKKVFKTLESVKLGGVLERYEDIIVEFNDVVMGLGRQEDPRVNYKALLEELVESKPKLGTLVDELKEAQLATKAPPKRKVLKHLKEEEPPEWQEYKHKRMSAALDVQSLLALLQDHIAELNEMLDSIEAVAYGEALPLAANVKTAGDKKFDAALKALGEEKVKELNANPAIKQHAKTILDYYLGPLLGACEELKKQEGQLNSNAMQAVAWALDLAPSLVETYKPVVQGVQHTRDEMVKWLENQKTARLKRFALQAPKVEIDPEYKELIKDVQVKNEKEFAETVKALNALPYTKKELARVFDLLTRRTKHSCDDFVSKAYKLLDSEPLTAISNALSMVTAFYEDHAQLANTVPTMRKNLVDWFDRIYDYFERSNKGEDVRQVDFRIGKAMSPEAKAKVLQAAIKALRSIDWGQPPNGQLKRLEKVSDTLSKVGIEPVDVNLAISNWSKGYADEARKFVEGPSGRGSNKGAIKDLQAMLTKTAKKKTAEDAKKPNPAQVAKKLVALDPFKKAVADAESEEELADAILNGLSEMAKEFGNELVEDEKYAQSVLEEVLKQLK